MKTIDYIRMSLETSKAFTFGLLDDMKDSPLTQPTATGGNHPLWILGHLTYAEANIVNHIILGKENPLIGWKEMFGAGREPTTEANDYLPWDEVRPKFDEVRTQTMSLLDGLSEEDLDAPSKNCPPERDAFFGKVGQCFLVLTLHPMMHYGQIADSRRVLGRKPLAG